MRPLVELNHGPRKAYPAVRIERPAVHDRKEIAEVLRIAVPLGLTVAVDEVRERLGFSKPEAGEDVLGAAGARGAPAGRLTTGRANTLDGAGDALGAVVDAIDGGTWETLAAPLIEPILTWAKADPEGLMDDIASAYPDMDTAALEERLARIMFVAEIWGRIDS